MASYRRRDRRGTRTVRERRIHSGGRLIGSPIALFGAIGLALALILISALSAPGLGIIDEPLWQLQQAAVFWRTVASVLLTLAVVAIAATLLAVLTGNAVHTPNRSLAKASGYALLVVALTTILCALCKDGWLPRVWPLYLLVTMTGAMFGIAMMAVMARAQSPALAFVLMSLLTGFVSVALLAGAVSLVLQPSALPIDGIAIDSADRVRLTSTLRAASPRNMAPGTTKTLALTASDINKLSVWGLSLGTGASAANERMAYVHLTEHEASAGLSLRWAPKLLREPVFLNVTGRAAPTITNGAFEPAITKARIGALTVPTVLANYLAAGLFDLVAADPRFSSALQALHRVAIEDQTLSATYGPMNLPSGLREDVFGKLGDDEVVAVAFSQHLHLQRRLATAFASDAIPRAERLAELVAESYALAARRHREFGSDAILENRLATIALGISLGHRKLSEVVTALPPEFNELAPLWRDAPLQGRIDWTRHFWVSAALTCLSDRAVSADMGQLKEELDAGTAGGSGFSFADLAADLAGVALATALTGERLGARRLQRELAQADQFQRFVPTLATLPEELSDQAMIDQYGGVNGERYQALVNEIATSIRTLPGYGAMPLAPHNR